MTYRSFLVGLAVFVAWPSLAAAQEDDAEPSIRVSPGEGVQLQSADERFGLQLGGLLQVWGTLREDEDAFGDTELVVGAEIRRAWINLVGHAFGEHNRLVVQFGQASVPTGVFDERPGFRLVDAYAEFTHLRDLEVRAGLMLLNFLREWNSPASNLALPERSDASRSWHLGRRFGVSVGSNDFLGLGRIRYRIGAFLGGFQPSTPAALGVMGRVDVNLVGAPDHERSVDLARSPSPRLAIGGAFAYLFNESGRLATTDPGDQMQATVDLIFRMYGASLEAAFLWRSADDLDAEIGAVATAAYIFPAIDLGLALRYGFFSEPGAGTDAVQQEYGGGLTYYVAGQDAFKVQLSLMRREFDSEPSMWLGTLAVQAQL